MIPRSDKIHQNAKLRSSHILVFDNEHHISYHWKYWRENTFSLHFSLDAHQAHHEHHLKLGRLKYVTIGCNRPHCNNDIMMGSDNVIMEAYPFA